VHEGIPGFSYVIVKRALLEACGGQSHSIVLDLYDQWKGLETSGQFRFTPPTHSLVAFRQAMRELDEEGGPPARLARYQRNASALLDALKEMGLVTLLNDNERGPIIQTILQPRDPKFEFEAFYKGLRARGFAIYPGKLTKKPSFRIGTIGRLDENVMKDVVTAIKEVLAQMGVTDMSPAE
jgi:2-aminoethylphosphonate-pyruvate transaminase